MPPSKESGVRAWERWADKHGAIQRYEADGKGRIYAEYANGAVLPTGLLLPSLAGQSNITHGALDQAIQEVRR